MYSHSKKRNIPIWTKYYFENYLKKTKWYCSTASIFIFWKKFYIFKYEAFMAWGHPFKIGCLKGNKIHFCHDPRKMVTFTFLCFLCIWNIHVLHIHFYLTTTFTLTFRIRVHDLCLACVFVSLKCRNIKQSFLQNAFFHLTWSSILFYPLQFPDVREKWSDHYFLRIE